jgi:iron complex transport system ATP-binding protein
MTGTAYLAADRVSVRYRTGLAVDEVSLAAEAGEWLGLIGANAAGKSSLLRAIAQLVRHEGAVHVGGVDLGHLSHQRRARLVAYVPQRPVLPPGISTHEYVLLGRTAHQRRFTTESARDHQLCLDLLDRMGLADRAGRELATLSGGELQRVVLARALAQEAPLVLLDEPTSALDLGRRVEALELVDELRRERGLTIVSAIHDLTLAAQFAGRLTLLDHGAVAASGTPDEVLEEHLLSRCYGGQVRVIHDADGQYYVVGQRTSAPDPTVRTYERTRR